ncbi:MAG: DUF3995 domain-containing protein [Shimia sp.]
MPLVSLTLLLIAALHVLWALRIWWPIRDEAALARAAVGTKAVTKMPPPILTWPVAVALTAAAFWPYLPDTWFKSLGLAVLILVFIGRGLVAYTPFWANLSPEEPFRTNDRIFYGPLCLGIGVSFLIFALRLYT